VKNVLNFIWFERKFDLILQIFKPVFFFFFNKL